MKKEQDEAEQAAIDADRETAEAEQVKQPP